jgi:3-dehydroquinate synthase
MKESNPRSLHIKSGQGDYAVCFEATLVGAVARVSRLRNAVLLADRRVATLYAEPLRPLFDALPSLLLDATEEQKTLSGVGAVASFLQDQGCTKQSTLVCLGGGIMQDLAALTAHLYYRGIKWVFLPTTLLSMSDSCIGAKSGINHQQYKNQLGAFCSPSEIIIVPTFVETLSDRDMASGHGEILKLLVSGSEGDFLDYEAVVAAHGLRGDHLTRLIHRSLEVKQAVIEADEYETDLRRILNYGHTFGHVLEVLTDYEVPHGLGVAWGMDLVNFISMKRGLLSAAWFDRIHAFIREQLGFRSSGLLSADALIAGTKRDKKVVDGQLNLALLERPGALKIVRTPYTPELTEQVSEYLHRHHAFAP